MRINGVADSPKMYRHNDVPIIAEYFNLNHISILMFSEYVYYLIGLSNFLAINGNDDVAKRITAVFFDYHTA